MEIKNITVDELKTKMDQKENFVLVDCREQHEWDDGHIDGAIFMPLSKFQDEFSKLDKSANIVLQCRSGRRSLDACYFLAENGYNNLSNLEGGILAWEDAGLPKK